MRFKLWIESAEGDPVKVVDALIEKMRGWHPKPGTPVDFIPQGQFEGPAAVLAGTKPAASFRAQDLASPVGQEIVRRAKQQGLVMKLGFGFWGRGGHGEYVIGHPQNVKAILDAYKVLNAILDGVPRFPAGIDFNTAFKTVMQAHKMVGINLGYPIQDDNSRFEQMITPQIERQIKQNLMKYGEPVGV